MLDESAVIMKMKEALGRVEDPRRQWGYLRHKLQNILVIGLCSVITGGTGFDEMEDIGRDNEEWFRRFPELPRGLPDEDTFRRMFQTVSKVQKMTTTVI